jgi:hypothetical protein
MRFLDRASYVFTLGRDNFGIIAKILGVKHQSLSQFKDFYGIKHPIPYAVLGRECYIVPLPHQPTYDIATRFAPYSKEEISRRLKNIGELI